MRYIIIGGSAAAISAVESIRSLDHESRIDLFSDEETPLFSRVLLPYYVAEELSKPLLNFRTSDFFDEKMVTPHMGVKVTDVNPKDKTIKAADGKEYAFDKLLLATGGKAIVPPIPGIDKEGISTLKTMADAEKILNMKGKRAVVIGAGSIGVESCISLTRRGIKATLLEQLGQVMPTVFDAEAAAIVQQRIEDLGIEVITGEKALKFTGGKHVRSVVTDTRELPCDMVVLSVGVRPASELALRAGLTLGDMKGIRVDDCLMTSAQDIYAAGDVAETHDIARNTWFLNAIWPCAFE
jgi:NADPH-dependent 2,4-dienoyl-CoA reductase/sulfur reductase-like enzyme